MPKIFTRVMKNGVPFYPVLAIALGILVGALLNVILPLFIKGADSIFVYVYSASILPGMIPWFMILISHIRFRKLHPEKVEGHPFKMPGGTVASAITILFLLVVLVGMLFNKETVVSVVIGIIFLAAVTVYYLFADIIKMMDSEKLNRILNKSYYK